LAQAVDSIIKVGLEMGLDKRFERQGSVKEASSGQLKN
jgi:hypothetical protein